MSIKPPAPRCQHRNHLSISFHFLALDEALRRVRQTGYGGQNALNRTEQPLGKHTALAASASLYSAKEQGVLSAASPLPQVLPPLGPSSAPSVSGALPTLLSPLQRLQHGKRGWDSLPAGQFSWSSERTGNSLCVLLLNPLSELSKEWAASNLTKNSLFTVKMLMALLLNPAGARGIRHQTPVISAHPETAVAEKHTSQPLRTSKRL